MRLAVAGDPVVIAPRVLPEHRALRIRLRNDGDAPADIRRGGLRLLDAEGADLRALWTPRELTVAPGATATLDLVFRVRDGTTAPALLDVAGETVELPAQAPLSEVQS